MPQKRTAVRGRGEGSIYRTKDGRHRGAVAWVDEAGKLHRRYVSGRTAGDVQQKLRRVHAEVEARKGSSMTTVAGYAPVWLERLAGHVEWLTIGIRRGHLDNHILPALGDTMLVDLKPRHVQALLDELASQGMSTGTVSRIKSTLSTMLSAAVLDELVPTNVAHYARVPRGSSAEKLVLTAEQVRRIIDETTDDPLHALYVLNVTVGARQGELLALDWSDVDLASRTLNITKSVGTGPEGPVVKDTKTRGSRRIVALPTAAVTALAALRAESPRRTGAVFRDAEGVRLRRHVALNGWTAMLVRLGLPPARFHDGRHTAASLLLANGQPVPVVSRMLGHSNPRVTMTVYAHAIPGTQQQAADAMDALLAPKGAA